MQTTRVEQSFCLGILLGDDGYTAPAEASIELEGHSIFAKISFAFRFDLASIVSDQLFLMLVPPEAVVTSIVVEGRTLELTSSLDAAAKISKKKLQSIEEVWSSYCGHIVTIEVSTGREFFDIRLDFVLAMEVIMHSGSFAFAAPVAVAKTLFKGRWDLAMLSGSSLRFRQAAAGCRLQDLGGSRYLWSQDLSSGPDKPIQVELTLDEKKPVSIAVFSPDLKAQSDSGCAAVAVIAPARPPHMAEGSRLAILLEIQSPQEGLLIRSLVEKICSLLKDSDKVYLCVLGQEQKGAKPSWTAPAALSEGALGRLIEPASAARAQDFWQSLQGLSEDLSTATSIVLIGSGVREYPPLELLSKVPVYVFASGRAPFLDQLSSLAYRSGGFIQHGITDSLDVITEKLRLRLCPPLLSGFKIEGWSITDTYPAGASRVFTDQPTLVMGLYQGVLPGTVTLTGCAPNGHKLAQRVRVEALDGLNLMPLYLDRVAHWDGTKEPIDCWMNENARALRISHQTFLSSCYQAAIEEPKQQLHELPQPASHEFLSTEVDISFAGKPSLEGEPESFFGQQMPAWLEEKDFFASIDGKDSEGEIIFGEPIADEIDLFSSAPASFTKAPTLIKDTFAAPFTPAHALEPDVVGEEAEGLEVTAQIEAAGLGEMAADAEVAKDAEPGLRAQDVDADLDSKPGNVSCNFAVLSKIGVSWLERFSDMNPDSAKLWLSEVSIDKLSRAVSLLDEPTAELILQGLDSYRQRAVRTQIAWARLLDEKERRGAQDELLEILSRG